MHGHDLLRECHDTGVTMREVSPTCIRHDAMDDPRAVLRRLPFLDALPQESQALLVSSFVPVSFPHGSIIMRAGAQADALYVLSGGRARVIKTNAAGEDITLRILRPGDYFGENALLHVGARTATVQACDPVQAFKLAPCLFRDILRDRPELRARLERSLQRTILQDFLRTSSPFSRMPAEAIRQMIPELETLALDAGQQVILHGHEPGPLFIVREGQLQAFVEKGRGREFMRRLEPGDVFGEVSIFRTHRRTATVEASSPCALLRLAPEAARRLAARFPEFQWQIEAILCRHGWPPV